MKADRAFGYGLRFSPAGKRKFIRDKKIAKSSRKKHLYG